VLAAGARGNVRLVEGIVADVAAFECFKVLEEVRLGEWSIGHGDAVRGEWFVEVGGREVE
jgi:hypothetical protein